MKKGHIAFILCAVVSILFPPLAAQDLPAEGAILEYQTLKGGFVQVYLDIDGQRFDTKRPGKSLKPLILEYSISTGTHVIGLQTEGEETPYPKSIEFKAEAGKRYRAHFESLTHKETVGGVTTLHFNRVSPAISIPQGKKLVPFVSSLAAPFKPQKDLAKNLLLYEDTSLPMERTARLYCPRKGLPKTASVYFVSISGDAGTNRVEYRRRPWTIDPWQLRLLPGTYRFVVTLVGGAWKVAQVVSGEKEITLQVEAGRTYRLLLKSKADGTQFSKDAIGNTRMTTSFSWEPYFEDVTGKGYTDQ
jgi:hypothetical protein